MSGSSRPSPAIAAAPAAPARDPAGEQLQVDLGACGAARHLAPTITSMLATAAIARGAPAVPARDPADDQQLVDPGAGGAGQQLMRTMTMVLATAAIARARRRPRPAWRSPGAGQRSGRARRAGGRRQPGW